MKYLILLLCPLLLMGQQVDQESDLNPSFFYGNSGVYYAGPDIQGFDFGVGYRNVLGFSGYDVNIGGTWFGILRAPVLPFIQASYLFYPLQKSGPYTGIGASIIPYTGWGPLINFPLIVGYQTSPKDHPVFIQLQYSPFIIPGATCSFGVGF